MYRDYYEVWDCVISKALCPQDRRLWRAILCENANNVAQALIYFEKAPIGKSVEEAVARFWWAYDDHGPGRYPSYMDRVEQAVRARRERVGETLWNASY